MLKFSLPVAGEDEKSAFPCYVLVAIKSTLPVNSGACADPSPNSLVTHYGALWRRHFLGTSRLGPWLEVVLVRCSGSNFGFD